MSANLDAKKQVVAEIKDKIKKAKSLTFVDYRGLSSVEDTSLRKSFRDAGGEYRVYKNRLVVKALEELGYKGFDKVLEGTNAVAFGYEDEITPNQILVKFIEANKKLELKGGLLDGKQIDAKMCEMLAKIPSKEVLLTKLLFLLQSPMRGLAVSLNAIAEKNAK